MKSNCTYNALVQVYWIRTYMDFMLIFSEPFIADYIL